MKLFISAGHQSNTGANGYIKEGEQAIYLRDKITSILKDKISSDIVIANDSDEDSLSQTIQGMRTYNPDISLDIHFNSFSKETASGSEIYISDMKSSKMAEKMLSVTCEVLGTKNRGVKVENQSQHNRLGMLHCNNKNAIMMLLEVCFVTNKCDVCKYNLNKDILAEKLADVIMSFCQEIELAQNMNR